MFYFDGIINGKKINFSNSLLNKKLYENTSVYDISYKILAGPKPLRKRFDKKDGFIMYLNGKIKHIICLVLFVFGLFDKICDKIKYLISKKIGITNNIYHNLGTIRIDSSSSLPIKKKFTFQNVITFIKSVVINKNEIKYYYNIVSVKRLYKHKFQ